MRSIFIDWLTLGGWVWWCSMVMATILCLHFQPLPGVNVNTSSFLHWYCTLYKVLNFTEKICNWRLTKPSAHRILTNRSWESSTETYIWDEPTFFILRSSSVCKRKLGSSGDGGGHSGPFWNMEFGSLIQKWPIMAPNGPKWHKRPSEFCSSCGRFKWSLDESATILS